MFHAQKKPSKVKKNQHDNSKYSTWGKKKFQLHASNDEFNCLNMILDFLKFIHNAYTSKKTMQVFDQSCCVNPLRCKPSII